MYEKEITLLKQARAIVEKGWARGALAMDAQGRTVGVKSPEACSFCLSGALIRAGATYHGTLTEDGVRIFDKLQAFTPERLYIHHWNDMPGRAKEEVLALIDKAVAAFEEEANGPAQQSTP